ncbi:conserved hypothetical protein [Ricinus communis]|uniref:Uncharacterized protein n=1 Tax=Ricinus communis TaxID=3988 RepID=B9SNP2_RICCO|nr:conserved hypothetical protein [Ricinus communis]
MEFMVTRKQKCIANYIVEHNVYTIDVVIRAPNSTIRTTDLIEIKFELSLGLVETMTSRITGEEIGLKFVFVVDDCIDKEELRAVKNELLLIIEQLPENALVDLLAMFHGEREVKLGELIGLVDMALKL